MGRQPDMPSGFQAQTYPGFTERSSRWVKPPSIPAGSWDISLFNAAMPTLSWAHSRPPVTNEGSDTCYISDHVDIAMGLNTASENSEAAMVFLEWMTTAEFAELYSNALPGFFGLSDHDFSLEDPLANEFLSWRSECEGTIRSSYAILDRGDPSLELELWRLSAAVINGDVTPQEAADELQAGLSGWYEPQM